jgi:hypothetical protein
MQKSFADLMTTITAQTQVWVRVCATFPEQDGTWNISVLDITAGEAPLDWFDLAWDYPRVRLRARVVSPESVCGWFDQSLLKLDEIEAPLPPISPETLCPVTRRSSGSSGIHGACEWPYEEWTIPLTTQTFASVNEELIGDGACPSFVSPNVAMAAMLGLRNGGYDSNAKTLLFREQCRTCE